MCGAQCPPRQENRVVGPLSLRLRAQSTLCAAPLVLGVICVPSLHGLYPDGLPSAVNASMLNREVGSFRVARGGPNPSFQGQGPSLWTSARVFGATACSDSTLGSWIVGERGFVAPQVGSNSSIYGGGAYLSRQAAAAPERRLTVASVIEAELDGMSSIVVEQQLPWLLSKDPSAVRDRLDRLKEALPGCNVSAVILGAPRLAWADGPAGAEHEVVDRARHTFLRLQEFVPSAYAAELVTRLPRLLLRDFSTRLEPQLAFVKSAFQGCDVGYLLHKNPALLTRSISASLQPRLDLLRSFFPGISAENLTSLVGGHQELWALPASALSSRISELEALVPRESILPILIRHPRTWTADLDEVVGPQTSLLRSCLQEETVQQVICKLPSALYYAPARLQSQLSSMAELFGGAEEAERVLRYNPMTLAVDMAGTVRPKYQYLRALVSETMDDEAFLALMKTEQGARLLTASFGRLGRLGYVLQVNPFLSAKASLDLVTCGPDEIRRKYPGYENFLEDRIECRFPHYTWEQIVAVPFSVRERVHGEILQRVFAEAAARQQQEEEEEGAGVGLVAEEASEIHRVLASQPPPGFVFA